MVRRLIRFVFVLTFLCAVAGWVVTEPLFLHFEGFYRPIASPSVLKQLVTRISTEFSPRDEQHPENLNRLAEFLRDEFRRSTTRVTEQHFRANGLDARNIYAEFGPEHGPVIVVGAHYDAAGPFPGADDNATGVAALLELARLFGSEEPSARIVIAAYSLEEPPFFSTGSMGSVVHATTLREQGESVRLMISLEMLGYFSDEPGSQHFPVAGLQLLYPSVGNFIAVVSTPSQIPAVRAVKRAMILATPLSVASLNAPRLVPGVDFSDHRSFLDAGFPAVMVTDTAMNRNTAYHSSNDTAARLDFDRMGMVVDGVRAAVLQLAVAEGQGS